MHFQLEKEAIAFRDEVRAHLLGVLTPDFEERLYRSGVAHDDEFAHGLVDKGLFAPQGSAIEVQLLKEEMMRFDAPVYLSETSRMVASVIRHAGTPEMRERIVPGAMNGGHHHRARVHRTRVRLRRRGGANESGAFRRRLDHQRIEDVHHERSYRRLRLPAGPDQPRDAQAQGPDDVPRAARRRRR